MTQPREAVAFEDAAHLDAWLAENYDFEPGVWLKVGKKGALARTVTSDEVNDLALCWGWITGHRKALDDEYFLQKITPRRRRSNWSRINIDRVQELIAAGRMQPPGLAAIDEARADGRFDRI